MERKNLFLDYGGLIFNYDFNRETLQRAHRLALSYINSLRSSEVSTQALETAHNKAIKAYLQDREGNKSEWTMNQIMSLMVSELGINADVELLEEIYKLNDHNSFPYPHSRRVLDELSKEYKLGIISNLPHDSILIELKREKMVDMFNPIIVSYQVGVRKPHPKIYQTAMQMANTTPKKSIFISHELEEANGAKKVGMRGVLVKSLEEVIGIL